MNWCPAQGTVLANEEVQDGKYVETGDPVERRVMKQWMLRITEYAERLLTDLEGLDWPAGILEMQRNWIGRSEGAEVRFDTDAGPLVVFTTRPDTLFGAKFIALAADHPLAKAAAEKNPALAAFADECRRGGTSAEAIETAEKQGFDTGLRVVQVVPPSVEYW